MKEQKTLKQKLTSIWSWSVAVVFTTLILLYCAAIACAVAKLIHG